MGDAAALRVVDSERLRIERSGHLLEEIRRNSRPENRLPKDLLEAAAYAIACEEEGVAHKHDVRGSTYERFQQTSAIESRTAQLLTAFQIATPYRLDSSEPDIYNGGHVLKVTVDATQLPVSSNLVSVAAQAIEGKIRWMGYGLEKSAEGMQVTLTFPAYKPPGT